MICRSTKAGIVGETWKLIHITGHTSGVSISPTDSDVVIYSNLEGPIERTIDGGLTWNPVNTGDVEVRRLDPAQEGANIFYCGSICTRQRQYSVYSNCKRNAP